jgi:integrase
MTGSIVNRGTNRWAVILELGYQPDPKDPARQKRKQKWFAVRGIRKDATNKLAELIDQHNKGTYVAPHKRSVAEWMTEWLEKAIKPRRTAGTHEVYEHTIRQHVRPAIGDVRLQALHSLDLERLYATLATKLAPATVSKVHVIIHGALEAAVRSGYVTRNVAKLVNNKPHASTGGASDVLAHCWQAHEARTFLAAAKTAGSQSAAFFALALDSGARKSELCGLKWSDLDVATGRLTIQRQLARHVAKDGAGAPLLVPTKTKAARTIDLGAETLELLKAHRVDQAELKMRNRQHYHDHGLMFAKEWGDLHGRQDSLGQPLQANNLGQREYARIIKAAGVRAIKFHGLRHTCATLSLSAGVQPHVVQRRLGHKRIEITLGIYGHVLPSMQADAAARLSALLHG